MSKETELERARQWKRDNKERHAALNRKSYHANKERINAARRAAYKQDPEKVLAVVRASREKRRKAHNAYQREYQRQRPEYVIAISQTRRARVRKATVERVTAADIRALYARTPACPYCAVELTRANRCLDHVVPLARGGHHCLSNLIPSCRTCNAQKGDKLIEEWSK